MDKAQQKIEALEEEIAQVKYDLEHLIDYAITYFKALKEQFGKGRERKTEIRAFEDIVATKVVIRNNKLYVNSKEGFIGTGLKDAEYVTDCSDIDDIICFTKEGIMKVVKVDSKVFIGKNIIYAGILKKNDKRTIYNLMYQNGKAGNIYMKRFNVTSYTRDREYNVGTEKTGVKVLYFSANPNGEAEIVTVYLRQTGKKKKLKFDVDFADMDIKGRRSRGNLVSKHPVKKIELKEEGVSTLKPRKIWFDEVVKRLNVDGRGEFLGEFKGEDRILLVTQDGICKTIVPELTTHFNQEYIIMEKWIPEKPLAAIYWEGEKQRYYVKRFVIENPEREERIITDHKDSQLELVATSPHPVIEIEYRKPRGKAAKPNDEIHLEEFIAVKGITAMGNQLTTETVNQINLLPSIVEVEMEKDNNEQEEDQKPENEGDTKDLTQGSLFDQ